MYFFFANSNQLFGQKHMRERERATIEAIRVRYDFVEVGSMNRLGMANRVSR